MEGNTVAAQRVPDAMNGVEDQSVRSSCDQRQRDFGYTSPHDSGLKRWLIDTVERVSGKKRLKKIYHQLQQEEIPAVEVWGRALELLDIQIDYDRSRLELIPDHGPIVFIANHPFGMVDGAIFCHLISRRRSDFFLLVNEVVADEPMVEGHLLPIDFRPGKDALRTNINTKRVARERLKKGEALAIFPSGGVATAKTLSGPAEELPWSTFVSRCIRESRSSIVPLFFHGQNSRLFQLASRVNENLRLGLLLHEVRNKCGSTIRVEIGEPIPYSDVQRFGATETREMVEFLKHRTMSLGAGESYLEFPNINQS